MPAAYIAREGAQKNPFVEIGYRSVAVVLTMQHAALY